MIIKIRTRYFFAVEGEGEQSFVKWLQQLTDQHGLHVHLDCQCLNGGGREVMLKQTLRYLRLNERKTTRASISNT